MQPDQDVAGAPPAVRELDGRTLPFEPGEGSAHPRLGQRRAADGTAGEGSASGELLDGQRTTVLEVALDALGHRLVSFDERVGDGPQCGLGRLASLGGHPGAIDRPDPPVIGELLEPAEPRLDGAAGHQGQEELVELVGITWPWAELIDHLTGGRRVERAEVGGIDGEAARGLTPRHGNRSGPALLQRCTVEERVGLAVQDPVSERRRIDGLDAVDRHPAGLDVFEECHESGGVQRFRQAVVDGLADEDVVRNCDRTRSGVLLAGGKCGPRGGQEIVGLHPLEVDGPPLATPGSGDHEGPVEVPPPPGGQHGMGQHGLDERVVDRGAGQHLGHPGEREAVLRPERQHHRVVVGRRLELEVERDTEPLAQGQAESAVDPAPVGGVDDELGALGLVEHPLDDDPSVGG